MERLAKLQQETLRYLHDFQVPFDNNLAERDIRMMRVQQKISGSFRSYKGALAFCRIRSYISTIRKQGLSVIDAIMNAFEKRSDPKRLPSNYLNRYDAPKIGSFLEVSHGDTLPRCSGILSPFSIPHTSTPKYSSILLI